ncbi:hypothetical protein Pmani_031309 [Petrolisthes manimaculis]|uniref:Uncharacterized protein n=1 Tax=Petrolisthes manimaculis TaxID=1843537 RepID=A0AAE1NVF6_9EUCA|nr:hypothetical protein Pmani_031309 [Petrolisthes manimaculis]
MEVMGYCVEFSGTNGTNNNIIIILFISSHITISSPLSSRPIAPHPHHTTSQQQSSPCSRHHSHSSSSITIIANIPNINNQQLHHNIISKH